ncbi:DUF342 domain-containing protein [Mesobacillus zeae]|nr:FapA family protein [Mesobacillus zeae]
MDKSVKVTVSKDGHTASISIAPMQDGQVISRRVIEELLKEEKIVYGIKYDVLEEIVKDAGAAAFQIKVAEGVRPVNGRDAYLRSEVKTAAKEKDEKLNFRDVLNIPSVRMGQALATIVPAEKGKDGIDVAGRPIPAKQGKPLRVRPGKNVAEKNGKFYSLIDGKVSITHKSISVNPVYEVRGDLDLRTGNIDFPGSIQIKGDVPAGYELIAGGDIIILGTVEGANLKAGGSVIVSGGVASGHKGRIEAEGNVQAAYLNQADVAAGGNILIKTSILNSQTVAGGNIDCSRGTVIGGMLAAGKNVYVKELGSHLFAKTDAAAGWDPVLIKEERELNETLQAKRESLRKLEEIEVKISSLAKHTRRLSVQQMEMLEKQKRTKVGIQREIYRHEDRLLAIEIERREQSIAKVCIYGSIYPNVKLHFGKYTCTTSNTLHNVHFGLSGNEIRFHQIEESVKDRK